MAPILWTDKSERDLLLAIVITHLTQQNGTDLKVRINWDSVTTMLQSFGYDNATSGGIGQHLTKKILYDYKQGLKAGDTEAPTVSTGTAASGTPKKPRSRKAPTKPKGKVQPIYYSDDEPMTPRKRMKGVDHDMDRESEGEV
ncbi:uncharacterized protein GGS25DRAFT_473447 [Hypoxylon fragiforme]|uniref:uncharacterized protein n=1 Tax=Hypoxylon fragiforme TaxID=63214 RepID=UPI0020C5EF29|nr:uncharacterized protein GGS25DRAFT_473447 [Hypoxylon fragiforme]KAI2612010.1 hypothetical protein GGS25DRAFT_473447 [Hypoxylon fragiforme]